MHGEHRLGRGDLEDPEDSRVGRDERSRPTGGLGGSRPLDEHAKSGGVEERATGEIDDHAVGQIGSLERLLEFRAGRHVELAVHPDDGRFAVVRSLHLHFDIAGSCHGRECR